MRYLWPIILSSFIFSCAGSKKSTQSSTENQIIIGGKIWTSLFQQKAAEYNALCIQAYNIARLRLDESLSLPSPKPLAIITDIDETFLDNSPYSVHRAFEGKNYDNSSWQEWTSKGIADTLYGALGFFNYAASKNVEVFYVSNRKEAEGAGTLLNLQRYSFPFADNKHLLLRTDGSSKQSRRETIAADYTIVLLLGDNLNDFTDLFEGKSTKQRSTTVRNLAAEFGNKFIILPNANYGSWEDAIYNYNYDLTPAQKDSAIKTNLKTH